MSSFHTILVVVDSSVERHAELERAIKLCDQSHAKLHLIDVLKDVSWTVRLLSKDYAHIHELLIQEKAMGLNRLVEHCQSHGVAATGEVLEGLSSQVTLDTAQRIGADLIIRAAKGERSLAQGALGSSAQRLIRRLPCSIWLTRPAHEPEYQVIVAAVDATPNDSAHANLNRRILKTAVELAKRERCKLLVTYAWSLYGSEMLSHRLPASEFEVLMDHNRRQHVDGFETLLSEFDLHATGPDVRMIEGEPSSAIPELCQKENANLLVCGTVARHGLAGLLLGNTAERILNRVNCSVLAIVPPAA
jgi:universal stress protein E